MRLRLSFACLFLLSASLLQAQQSQFLQNGAAKIHYRSFGTGQPILIINGGPGMNSDGFVNMGDVLFDTGRFTLRQLAREKLARLAGIVLNYPGLKLEAEGHTDNVGSEALNQKLSEQRANSVREYLVSQGITNDKITSSGKGFSMPVADNKTATGRQQNRRVELIVSGEVIGAKIGN